MDSTHQNQFEQHHVDLMGVSAIKKIQEIVKDAETCFFCTEVTTAHNHSRPMSVQHVDESGNLWFLSPKDSNKNLELASDSLVKLYFQRSPHSGFLQIDGVATVSTDKAKIKELWKPILKTWFTEGEDDPRITVIKVAPTRGHYWDNKHGDTIAGVKMMVGAAIGKTLDDSIEGAVTV